ncbi:hypothetical protein WT83_11140 [Burkholderia territorii]|uniref:Uncharacterized protein n=1 Tax=Burkholderia territorii TaxID=1503055 RepID=A0A108EVB8_9BURK|nr:hypothetical protein WT83_11140 [Burkholderia territorii]
MCSSTRTVNPILMMTRCHIEMRSFLQAHCGNRQEIIANGLENSLGFRLISLPRLSGSMQHEVVGKIFFFQQMTAIWTLAEILTIPIKGR